MNDFNDDMNGNNSPSQGNTVGNGDVNPCKLYVGNLPYSIKTQELSELFSPFGEMKDCVVMMDKTKYNWSKGFGFVEYVNPEDAEKAVKAMAEKEVDGRKLQVNIAQPKPSKANFNDATDGFTYY